MCPTILHGRFIVGWPSGLLCRAVDTARPIRPAGQPLLSLISVLSIVYSFHSASFSTFRWPAALSSGQRRWRFPPCGTLPGATFLPFLPTVSFDFHISGSPLRRLRPSPPRVGSSGAGSGSSATALQLFLIQLLIHCSRVALSGSVFLLSGGLPASGRPRFSKIAVHASFTQLQPLLHTSPAGR